MKKLISIWFCLIMGHIYGQNNCIGLYNSGIDKYNSGKYDLAIEYFSKAIKCDPRLTEVYYLRGSSNSQLKKYDKALKDFSTYLEYNPEAHRTYFERGFAYYSLAQMDSAVIDFSTAISLSPKESEYYYWRALVNYEAGNMVEARKDFQIAADLGHKDSLERLKLIKLERHEEDITGGNSFSEIILASEEGRSFKLVIEIDGVQSEFLFDTGATTLTISPELEAKLIQRRALTSEDWLGKTKGELADNSTVKAKKYIVQNVKIGEYVVDNVEITVLPDGGQLCGMSLLTKFRRWTFDSETSTLTLFK